MSEPTENLPPGWAAFPIEELFQPLADGRKLHHGWSPQCDKDPAADGEWGVLKTTAVQDGAYLSEHNKRLPTKLKPRAHFEVKQGDLLITCAGPRVRCGVPCLVRETRDRLILSGKMYRFRVRPEVIDSRYMEAYLRSPETQRLIDKMKTGISDSGLNLTHGRFFTLQVPVAPPAEQRRIVAKIEELFSDLDAGVAALERVRANLKRYRAAVLKAAVEGHLTDEWRTRHPATEPAAQLLERILAERRAKWEQDQLRKFKEAGKTPPKGWKEKYEAPPEPADLPSDQLPEQWVWATLLQLGSVDRGRSRHRPRDAAHLYGGPYPFVQTGDIGRANTFIRSYKQTYSEAGRAQSRLWPKGTLCITIAANIAETAILDIDACFPDSVVGFAPAGDAVSVRYVELYFRTVQKNLERWAPATAQKNINVETLTHLPVRLPPAAEQIEIVAEVDCRLSVADATETQVEHALQRAARLRQSILKRAFEGKLVPQDPTDEPAEKLFGRVSDRVGADTVTTTKAEAKKRGRTRVSA